MLQWTSCGSRALWQMEHSVPVPAGRQRPSCRLPQDASHRRRHSAAAVMPPQVLLLHRAQQPRQLGGCRQMSWQLQQSCRRPAV